MKNKTISWKRATDLLQKCSAVEWGDGFVCSPAVIVGDNKEIVVELSYLDEEGQMFDVYFEEIDNQKVTISHSSMFLTDTEGNEEQISLLGPQKISSFDPSEAKPVCSCGSGLFDEKGNCQKCGL